MMMSRISTELVRHASALALGIALATTAASADVRNDDAAARNEAIVRQAFDEWAGGGNVFARLLDPKVSWTIHGSAPVAGTYTGIDEFIERAAMPLISRLATPLVPQVHDIWAVGETVIVRFDGSATTISGTPYANQFVWIFRMKDGLVSEAEAFLDLAAYQAVVDNNEPRTD